MILSNVQALAWILPDLEPGAVSHEYSARLTTRPSSVDNAEILIKDEKNQERVWKVDKCMTNISSISIQEERKKLTTLALNGYNSACLFFNIGGDYCTYQRRMEEKRLLFEELNKVIQPNTKKIEYIYFGIADSECYNLRKETPRSNKLVLERGIDSWMKEVDSVTDIWNEVCKGSRLPYVLKIRLTDHITKCPGYFYLFDLLQPRFSPFSPDMNKNQNHLHDSFEKLREFVNLVVSSPSTTIHHDIIVSSVHDNVLISLLAPFICGSGKLVLFNHFKEYPKNHTADTMMALDFIETLRKIKTVVSSPNSPIVEYDRVQELEEKCRELEQIITEKTNQANELLLRKQESMVQQQLHDDIVQLKKNVAHLQDTCLKKSNKVNKMKQQLAINKRDVAKDRNRELQKKLNFINKKLSERRTELAHICILFKKGLKEASEKIQKMKRVGAERESNLKKEIKNQTIKAQIEMRGLQIENARLQQSSKIAKVMLAREVERTRMETEELRGHLKSLKETIEQDVDYEENGI